MATVATLLSLLDDKLLHYARDFDLSGAADPAADREARKIRALNAGKHKIWQILVAASRPERASWFAKSTAVSINLGTNSVTLPADCHDVLFVESSTVKMVGSTWAKDSWRADRADSTNEDMTVAKRLLYVVAGDSPPVLHVGRKPAANLAATVHYTSILPEWSASADNIDRVPTPYWDAICNYAATLLTSAMQDPETAKMWSGLWTGDEQTAMSAAGSRSSGQNLTQDGMDPQS